MVGVQSLFEKPCKLQAANPYIIIYSLIRVKRTKTKRIWKKEMEGLQTWETWNIRLL